jgi:Tol biopolymer transport system component
VAFESAATNLVPLAGISYTNVFRKDLETGEVLICSSLAGGESGDAGSNSSRISSDGRYVVFSSVARNLEPDVDYGWSDVFRKDLETGELVCCSTASNGIEMNDIDCGGPSISADGRYAAFTTYYAEDIGKPEDEMSVYDMPNVYRKDLATGNLVLCNTSRSGEPGSSHSIDAEISADGRYVAFGSAADNLLPKEAGIEIPRYEGDPHLYWNIFRKDLETGEVLLCSASTGGEPVRRNSNCSSISSDGRYVLFISEAENLVTGDTNQRKDLFRKDLVTGEIIICSTSSDGEIGDENTGSGEISANGRYVAFNSHATNFAPVDNTEWQNVFRKDLLSQEIVLCATSDEGIGEDFIGPTINSDGRFVAFVAQVRDDRTSQVYRRELTFDEANP